VADLLHQALLLLPSGNWQGLIAGGLQGTAQHSTAQHSIYFTLLHLNFMHHDLIKQPSFANKVKTSLLSVATEAQSYSTKNAQYYMHHKLEHRCKHHIPAIA
jgi:hypothetical protein